jgi:hypothetical protein
MAQVNLDYREQHFLPTLYYLTLCPLCNLVRNALSSAMLPKMARPCTGVAVTLVEVTYDPIKFHSSVHMLIIHWFIETFTGRDCEV